MVQATSCCRLGLGHTEKRLVIRSVELTAARAADTQTILMQIMESILSFKSTKKRQPGLQLPLPLLG